MEFLKQVDPLLKSFWYLAIPVSLIFVALSIMTFLGPDAQEADEHAIAIPISHGPAFRLLSFRNFIHFLLGFSWTGISLYNYIDHKSVLIIMSVIVGASFVVLFFFLMRQINQFSEDIVSGAENTVDKTGSVNKWIPGHKTGKGKVKISMHGDMLEMEALTEQESIEPGARVRIVGLEDHRLVLVEKI